MQRYKQFSFLQYLAKLSFSTVLNRGYRLPDPLVCCSIAGAKVDTYFHSNKILQQLYYVRKCQSTKTHLITEVHFSVKNELFFRKNCLQLLQEQRKSLEKYDKQCPKNACIPQKKESNHPKNDTKQNCNTSFLLLWRTHSRPPKDYPITYKIEKNANLIITKSNEKKIDRGNLKRKSPIPSKFETNRSK